MKRQNAFVTAWIVLIVLSTPLLAGQIHLINGDRFTGTITTMANGKITIETALAGTVEVAMENVQTISSDEPLELHLKDGTVIKQPVEKDAEGMIRIVGSGTIKSQALVLSDVTAINPPKPEPPRWKGDLSAGASYSSGNTSNESYAFSGNLTKRSEKKYFGPEQL